RAVLRTKGAAAIVTVVEDAESVEQQRGFRSSERLILPSDDADDLSVFASAEAMQGAFGAEKWAGWVTAADGSRGSFKPTALDALINIDARTKRREVRSHNFIGRLPGTNPDAGAILLLGHWDHFGICRDEGVEDRLCNGAVDNASGIALMLELARRVAKDGPLQRDLYVLGTTAEEWGLLGARAFAEEPPIPLENIVAAFNFDTVAIGPRGSKLGFIGQGETPLDAIILEAVADAGRELAPKEQSDPFIQRQDGWALLQRDVPTVVLSNAFGDMDLVTSFLSTDYHQPSDEPGNLELGGAVDDLLLHELLIHRLADPANYP
ncbi:MAG: M28 family peptidase, partial [Sphingomonadales bacterium]